MLKYKNIGIFLGLKTFDMFLGHDLKYERHPVDDDDENVVGWAQIPQSPSTLQ